MSVRMRELLGLVPVTLLVTAGFAAVLITRTREVSDATLTYGAFFLAVCLVGHLLIRARPARRRPVHVPAGGVAGGGGPGRDLPHRLRPGAQPGHLVRGRPGLPARSRSTRCATTTCWSATGTRSPPASLLLLVMPRLPGIGAPVNGAYLGDQARPDRRSSRPSSRSSGSSSSSRATCARSGEVLVRPRLRPLRDPAASCCCGACPRSASCSSCSCSTSGRRRAVLLAVMIGLPRGGDARAAVAQALRAAAAGLGPGDADAGRDPRPRQLAHVLRRLPRAALRGDRPAVAGGRGRDDVLRRRGLLRQQRQPRPRARRRSGCTRSTPGCRRRRGLPDRAGAVRAGRRRAVRAGLRPGAAADTRRRDDPARAAHRPDLRGGDQRARAVRRDRASCSSTCCWWRAASRPR